MGYEGGIEMAVPTGSANQVTHGMDLVYNPNWYWMDAFSLEQPGYANLHVSPSPVPLTSSGGCTTGRVRSPATAIGGNDNRLRLARPGQPHSKPAGVNVRSQRLGPRPGVH